MRRIDGKRRRHLLNESVKSPYASIVIEVDTWSRSIPEGLLGNLRHRETCQVGLICEEGRGVHVQILRTLFACWVIVVAALWTVAINPDTTVGIIVMRPIRAALKEGAAIGEDLGCGDTARRRHFVFAMILLSL